MLLVCFCLVLIALAFGGGVVYERRHPRALPRPAVPQRYSLAPSEETFTHVTFDAIAQCGSQSRILSAQPPEWRAGMAAVGERVRAARVKRIVFVHGTFVGDDPLAFVQTLRRWLPRTDEALSRAALLFTKQQSDRLLGDNANFVSSYVRLFEEAIGGDIPCASFVWSSENHHLGRIHGAVRLARELARHAEAGRLGRDRVLLVGHSHAGQLFALLTQLIAGGAETATLIDAARTRGEDVAALELDLAALRKLPLDIVTFGTPPRYGWGDASNYRLMNVVNHRGTRAQAGGLRGLFGLLHTVEGDYVQQFGVSGSDFPAALAPERRLNADLDTVLGHGGSVRALFRNLRKGLRVPQHGHTYLVDYRDRSESGPNFLSTCFGHGVYTRFGAMLFNARLIVDHFYPERSIQNVLAEQWGRLRLPPRGGT